MSLTQRTNAVRSDRDRVVSWAVVKRVVVAMTARVVRLRKQ